MMPIWKMRSRHGHFHWDGLNTDLTEVVLSGAIGDGATNKSLPVEQLKKVEDYINDVHPPAYPFPRNIDVKLVARGNEIYQQLCADCHSSTGKRNGTVIPLAEIGTDRHRGTCGLRPQSSGIMDTQKDMTGTFDTLSTSRVTSRCRSTDFGCGHLFFTTVLFLHLKHCFRNPPIDLAPSTVATTSTTSITLDLFMT